MPKSLPISDEQYFSELYHQFVRSTASGYDIHTDFQEVVEWLEKHSPDAEKIDLLEGLLVEMEDNFPHMMHHNRSHWLSLRERAYHCVRDCVSNLRTTIIDNLEEKILERQRQLPAPRTHGWSAWAEHALAQLQYFLESRTKTIPEDSSQAFDVTLFGESVRPFMKSLQRWLQHTRDIGALESISESWMKTINGFLTLLIFARTDHHKRFLLPIDGSTPEALPTLPLPIASLIHQFTHNQHLDHTAWCILWANCYMASNEVIAAATTDMLRNIKSAQLNELFDLEIIDSRMLLNATAEFRAELGTPAGHSMMEALRAGKASNGCLWKHYSQSGLRLQSFFNPKLQDGWQIRGIGLHDATDPAWKPKAASETGVGSLSG